MADLQRTPADIPNAFVAAWNARDPQAIGALFDDDAEFVNVTGLWWHSRAAIEQAHAYGLRQIFDASTLTCVETRVKQLADSVAVVHAKLRLTGQTPPPGTAARPGTRHTVFTFVVHRVADGWRCAAAHNTDVVPGSETNVAVRGEGLEPVSYQTRPNAERA
ncbi:YybH family protein [Salisaeta longa]|uniref:YybH family protein n=1 Tax=Salisaeta longa TaxID=503170 RepID=UPI0003B48FF7|nr:SgcJ/EcaC family oxidoreductase [Salisaeta longa]